MFALNKLEALNDASSGANKEALELLVAARAGDTMGVVTAMSKAGATPEGATSLLEAREEWTGHSALHLACLCGDAASVKILLAQGYGDPNALNAEQEGAQTALHVAAKGSFELCVAQLLDAKDGRGKRRCDVDLRSESGCSALHFACWSGSDAVVKLLLGTRPAADVDGVDGTGQAALHYVARLGHVSLVSLLVDKGRADVNLVNGKVRAVVAVVVVVVAVVLLVLLVLVLQVLLLLLTPLANGKGWNALHVAVLGQKLKLVRELLSVPSLDVNAAEEQGWTALHFCAYKHDEEILKLLLADSRVDLSVEDNYGRTPRTLAAENATTPRKFATHIAASSAVVKLPRCTFLPPRLTDAL